LNSTQQSAPRAANEAIIPKIIMAMDSVAVRNGRASTTTTARF
jgi:hypothetical protein